MKPARLAFAAPLLLLIAACDSAGGDGAGAVSEGEARALDEAAEMLEERRLPDEAIPPIVPEAGDATASETEQEGASE